MTSRDNYQVQALVVEEVVFQTLRQNTKQHGVTIHAAVQAALQLAFHDYLLEVRDHKKSIKSAVFGTTVDTRLKEGLWTDMETVNLATSITGKVACDHEAVSANVEDYWAFVQRVNTFVQHEVYEKQSHFGMGVMLTCMLGCCGQKRLANAVGTSFADGGGVVLANAGLVPTVTRLSRLHLDELYYYLLSPLPVGAAQANTYNNKMHIQFSASTRISQATHAKFAADTQKHLLRLAAVAQKRI